MSVITNLLGRLKKTDTGVATETGSEGMDRRQFLENMVYGGAIISTTWLLTDEAYDRFGGSFEEEWLRSYYKSDFVGV